MTHGEANRHLFPEAGRHWGIAGTGCSEFPLLESVTIRLDFLAPAAQQGEERSEDAEQGG